MAKQSKHQIISGYARRMRHVIDDEEKKEKLLKHITKLGWRKKHFWKFYEKYMAQ